MLDGRRLTIACGGRVGIPPGGSCRGATRKDYRVSGWTPSQFACRPADHSSMRTRVIPLPVTHGLTLRTAAAALVLIAVILVGVSGMAQVSVSGEPPALAAPVVTR
jgi:hypothetical protein